MEFVVTITEKTTGRVVTVGTFRTKGEASAYRMRWTRKDRCAEYRRVRVVQPDGVPMWIDPDELDAIYQRKLERATGGERLCNVRWCEESARMEARFEDRVGSEWVAFCIHHRPVSSLIREIRVPGGAA